MGRGGLRGAERRLALSLLMAFACLAAPAGAVTFVWQGKGATAAWHEAANWQGGHAPSPADGTVDLQFPLSGCAGPGGCPTTVDDLSALSVGELTLDSLAVRFKAPFEGPPYPGAYNVSGTALLKLSGGVDAQTFEEGTGEGSTQPRSIRIEPPLELTAANSWTVGPLGGQDLTVLGTVKGRHPLEVTLAEGDGIDLAREVETGPVSITGAGGSSSVRLGEGAGGDIDGLDREPVRMAGVLLHGSGALGPLTLADGTLAVGEAGPEGAANTTVEGNLELEGASTVSFQTSAQSSTGAGRLIVAGRAFLGGATLRIGANCPVTDTTYTLLEAADGVAGRFDGADGQPITDQETVEEPMYDCGPTAELEALRVEYEPDSVRVTALGASPLGGTPAPAGQPPPSAPQTAATAARAMLARDLAFLAAGRRIPNILAGRGEDVALTAPRPGIFTIAWRARIHGHSLLIATGRLMLPDGGTGQLRIILTAAGRRGLRHLRRVRVSVTQTFTPTGMAPVSAQTELWLRD